MTKENGFSGHGIDAGRFFEISFNSALDIVQKAYENKQIIVLDPDYCFNLRNDLERKYFMKDDPKFLQSAFVEEMAAFQRSIREEDLMRVPQFYDSLLSDISEKMGLRENDKGLLDVLYHPIHWELFVPKNSKDNKSKDSNSILHGLSRVFLSKELRGGEAEELTDYACKNYIGMVQARIDLYFQKQSTSQVLCA